jgi:hypothetical protein
MAAHSWPGNGSASEAEFLTKAALYAVGERLASGTVLSCLWEWSQLPEKMRADAYIQAVSPVAGKRMLRKVDVAELAIALGRDLSRRRS